MKKILSSLAFLSVLTTLGVLFLPAVVSAAAPTLPGPQAFAETCKMRTPWPGRHIQYDGTNNCPDQGAAAQLGTAQSVCCVFDTLVIITNWVFWGFMILVILFIIIGAYYIITAGGSPEKVNTGRQFVIYAATGALVALAARAIPGFAASLMGI